MALPDPSALLDLVSSSTDHTAIALITPGNNSGVVGLGMVSLNGDTLSVEVAATNLAPNEAHSLDVHGFADLAPETLATAAVDADGDGFVETGEGESSAYGSVLAGLLTNGHAVPGLEVSPDFPHADASGQISFAQTYSLDPTEPGDAFMLQELSARLDGHILEFHGLDLPAGAGIGSAGEVNGTAGDTMNLPVASGIQLSVDVHGGSVDAAVLHALTNYLRHV